MSKAFSTHPLTRFGDAESSLEILVPSGWESPLSEVDPGQLSQDTEAQGPMVEFLFTAWNVQDKHDKFNKVFATVLASFNSSGT